MRMLAQFFGNVRDEHAARHEVHTGVGDAGEGFHIGGQLAGERVVAGQCEVVDAHAARCEAADVRTGEQGGKRRRLGLAGCLFSCLQGSLPEAHEIGAHFLAMLDGVQDGKDAPDGTAGDVQPLVGEHCGDRGDAADGERDTQWEILDFHGDDLLF